LDKNKIERIYFLS